MALYIGGGSRQKSNIYFMANNLDEILEVVGGKGTVATTQELKALIKSINALGIENLSQKGVSVPENATTYEIMQKVADIKYEVEDNLSTIDEFGIVKARLDIDENGIVFGDISIDDNRIVNL